MTAATRPACPRRGLNREEAALYVGISVGKFDELVAKGLMPTPKRIDRRKVWDRHALDAAFEDLPDHDQPENEWDVKLSDGGLAA